MPGVTVVIPANNEAEAIAHTLTALKSVATRVASPLEVIVVDDGSTDATAELARDAGVRVISHPVNSGYGRSLITGIEAASHDTIAIVDADGTYPIDRLPDLLDFFNRGFDMAVGARQGVYYKGSLMKQVLRMFFRRLAEYTCGRSVPDINSGFRIFKRAPVLHQRAALSSGFSFTTSLTLLFMLNHLFVGYMPVPYNKRVGSSKVRLLRDSLRSLQLVVTLIAQYNPLKLYLILALATLLAAAALTALLPWLDARLSLVIGGAWLALIVAADGAIRSLVALKPGRGADAASRVSPSRPPSGSAG
jgi:glycosyltransferase involved in cell wall biosynthesis